METPQRAAAPLDGNPLTHAVAATYRTPPPVDPSIPLEGFAFDPARGLFVDVDGVYTYDPRRNVFTNSKTRQEYEYDTAAEVFRPRESYADAIVSESIRGLLSSGIKLKQEL